MFTSTGLAFAYPGSGDLHFPDVQLAAGERLLVLGPSGSGKSTLLGIWAGLLTPKQGTVSVGTDHLHELSGSERDAWRGRNVGLVFQRPRLLISQSVAANVQLPRRLAGLPVLSSSALHDLLRSLGIAKLASRLPAACSVGEQQRVGIARALVNAPTLLLADEPTSALDRTNALAVAKLLIERATARETALIVVTHDERLVPLFPRTLQL